MVQLLCGAEDGNLTRRLLLQMDVSDQLCLVNKSHCLLASYAIFPA